MQRRSLGTEGSGEGTRVPRAGSEGVGDRSRSRDPQGHRRDHEGRHTTICGTDLHILKGDVAAVTDGRVLGHEGVGHRGRGRLGGEQPRRSATGRSSPASARAAPAPTATSSCPSHCLDDEGASGIGWIFGHLIDGTQAEYVRVPLADGSLHKLPEGVSDEAAVMLSDILPTGFEIGVRNGRTKPGDVVAVVGAGPVGLSAIMTAGLYGPSRVIAIDLDENRLEQAKTFGATDAVNSGEARLEGRGLRDDRRTRRRRRDRGGRDSADVRDVHRADPAGRDGGERRRARPPGGAAPARPLDHGRRDHDRPGQRDDDADAPEARRPGEADTGEVRQPPLRAWTRSSTPTTRSAALPRRRRSRSQ